MAESKLINNISIVESGTDGMWTYRKWSDGIVECWGKNVSTAAVSAGYNFFATSLPKLFIQSFEPICTFSGGITGVANSWVAYQKAQWATDHWYIDGYLGNGGGATTGGWYYVHVIGRWK